MARIITTARQPAARRGLDRRTLLRTLLGAGGATFAGTLIGDLGGASWSRPVQAQAGFPTKPITIVCPYAAGATTDTVSRIVAQGLAAELGGVVVVENRPGAGGNIGTAAAAGAPPDGHTLVLGALGPFAVNGALYARLGFDPVADFAPLGLAASVPLALVVNPALGTKTVAEFVAMIRQQGSTTFASAGTGTPMHLAGELFKRETGLPLVHASYRGSAPAINDVIGGHVPLMFDALVNILPHVRGGTLRALATTAAVRPSQLDDVPTLKEAGYDVVVSGWYGFLVQAKTPEPIRRRLEEALARVVRGEEVRQKLYDLGSEPVETGPQPFRMLIRSESARWQPLVRALGLTAG
ncbi:Bug family tripartite tricarboxylate transporter substrate binding protein [Rhodoplanes serenus]|uniref:Bug family tripartite tricarboxylate transporter substrate binding protein n=1 Tax=Rhodoplanes serenus TaxID=200615 RepID=UPI001AECC9D3|nr:tripartite tricarboxylate transporter substrate-binding protein [Rhodoplanes serenus]